MYPNKSLKDYRKPFFYFISILTLIFPFCSWAHPNALLQQGFSQGFLHPLTGLDHSLAMLSVGLLASQNKKTPTYVFPLCFLTFMLLGGVIGFMKFNLPWIELGILLSVFVLGLIMSLPKQLPATVTAMLILIFAFCHGHAHGYEMLPSFNAIYYASGFLLATLAIHFVGYYLGYWIERQWKWLMSATGVAILISSFWI